MNGFPFDSTHWKVKLRLRCNTFVGGHKNIGKRFGKFIKINQFQRFSSLGWSVYIIWPWHVFCIFCILQSIRSFCGQMTKRQFEYWLRRFSLTKIFQTLPKKSFKNVHKFRLRAEKWCQLFFFLIYHQRPHLLLSNIFHEDISLLQRHVLSQNDR